MNRVWMLRGLAGISGVCGLSYEVLYARLVVGHFGAVMHVVMAVLGAFLLGVALGSLMAPRLVRKLPLFEAIVGCYAIGAAVFVLSGASLPTIEVLAQWAGGMPAWLSIPLAMVLVAVPAFLIGASLPLFAFWIEHFAPERERSSFAWAFAMYNLGAAVCLIIVELWVAPEIGAARVMLIAGALNLAVASALYFAVARQSTPTTRGMQWPVWDRASRVMLTVGVAEGVFMGWALTIGLVLYDGTTEVMAIVIAASLLGMPLGTWCVAKLRLSIAGWVLCTAGVLAFTAGLLGVFVDGWNLLTPWIYRTWSSPHAWVSALGVLSLLFLPATIMFGGVEPLLVDEMGQEGLSRSGEILFWSGLGSGGGLIVSYLVFPGVFGLDGTLVVVAGIMVMALLLAVGRAGTTGEAEAEVAHAES